MRIEVEPQELISAGEEIGRLGEKLGLLSSAMGQALASGVASGNDPAGMNFGISYGREADAFANRLAEAANAFTNVGRMLEATGYNYRNADAASVAGGPGPSGGIGAQPAVVQAGDAPYGPNGATVPPPAKWHVIQPLLNVIPGFGFFAGTAMTWPNGNSALMNVTAAQWRNIARGLSLFEPAMAAAKALAGAQNIPEAGDINQALADLGTGVTLLSNMAGQMATTVSDFATGVQETQDAIRRLLDRLSLDGLWDTVTGFLTGEGDDILREIARDVGTVLENFQNQVEGLVGLIKELGVLLGEAATAFQKWIRPVLVGVFGEEHGNILADAVTWYTDVQVGSVVALLGAVADTVALADPNTWKGMADMALSIAKDPSKLDDVLPDMGKEFIALDQIQGDHPGRGIGAAGFNIASLFIPGGALSKTGTLAKGLGAAQDLFKGRLPDSPGRLPGSGDVPHLPDIPDAPAAPNIPEFRSPGIPERVLTSDGSGGVGSGSPGSPPSTAAAAPGSGVATGKAPTGPSGTGPAPTQSGSGPAGGGAGPGGGSSTGPVPTGGPNNGPSSHGPGPAGVAPSSSGADGSIRPPESQSVNSSRDSAGSGLSGPNLADEGGGPNRQSSSGGDSSDQSSTSAGSRPSDGSPVADDSPSSSTISEAPGEAFNEGAAEGSRESIGDSTPLPVDDRHRVDAVDSGAHSTESETDPTTLRGDGGANSHPLHSGERSGDGWHRLDDAEIDPDYGHHQLENHWSYGDYPTEIDQRVQALISDPDAPWGRDIDGNPLSQRQYEGTYNTTGPAGEHWQNWPPNAGAVPETRLVYERMDAVVRDFGTVDGQIALDRIGKYDGDYLAVMPDGVPATFEQRSLPVFSLTQPYHQFGMAGHLPEGWAVEVSEVAPAFGREGGGIQVRILDEDGEPVLIPRLIGLGILQ